VGKQTAPLVRDVERENHYTIPREFQTELWVKPALVPSARAGRAPVKSGSASLAISLS
jgi:hypothetical protein